MISIKPEVKRDKLRKDNTFNVKVRVCYDRNVKRIPTEIYVRPSELNDDWSFKDGTPKKMEIDRLVRSYQSKVDFFARTHTVYTLDDIVKFLTNTSSETVELDFLAFCKEWISTTTVKGKKNYQTAVNSFTRYLKKGTLSFPAFTKSTLEGYKEFLMSPKDGKVASKRSASLYLGSLRHLFREAQNKYNDYDRNVILIPNDPFRFFKCPKQENGKKRAVSIETIRKIYELPYRLPNEPGYRRFNLAKDCYILSFCLIGMNSVDLYNASTLEGSTIIYNRTKTKDRRSDEALMKVDVPYIIASLFDKYRDLSSERVFRFHLEYSTPENFNRAINLGLKMVAEAVGVSQLDYYSARHSWATIAVNDAKVDKYTVHAALNHIDDDMKVTDIYYSYFQIGK